MLPNPRSRLSTITKNYNQKPIDPRTLYKMIRQSISTKKAISVIRLGDVIGKLLTRQELDTLKKVAPFLGIPYP